MARGLAQHRETKGELLTSCVVVRCVREMICCRLRLFQGAREY